MVAARVGAELGHLPRTGECWHHGHRVVTMQCVVFRSHDNGRGHEREADSGSVAEDRVELVCNDTLLDPNMDLR